MLQYDTQNTKKNSGRDCCTAQISVPYWTSGENNGWTTILFVNRPVSLSYHAIFYFEYLISNQLERINRSMCNEEYRWRRNIEYFVCFLPSFSSLPADGGTMKRGLVGKIENRDDFRSCRIQF